MKTFPLHPKTVAIGGANLDISGSCFERLLPGDSNPGVVKQSAGGVARNIAENLQRLGHACTLVSITGADAGRDQVLASCQRCGMNSDYLFTQPGLSTGTYLAVNNQLGTLLAAISDMAIMESLTPERLATALPAIEAADILVVDANLPEASLRWLSQQAAHKPLIADAVSATKAVRLRSLLPQLEILKVNRFEASAILQQSGEDAQLAQALHAQGVANVLFSQGPQGVILVNAEGRYHRSALKGENQSDTGTGDALLSGYIAARSLLPDASAQLDFAVACATMTLNSPESVNPQLSVANVRERYLAHLADALWRTN